MGLLKKLKKGLKRVFKGVKKIFKKAVKFIGKIAGSKFGKVLMLAAAVFSGGVALGAWSSWGGFTASGSGFFAQKFIPGINKIMSVMTGGAAGGGTGPLAGKVAGGAVPKPGPSAGQVMAQTPTGMPGASMASPVTAPGATTSASGISMQPAGSQTLGSITNAAGQTIGAAPGRESLMARALGWAKSTGGQNLIGSMLEGYERGEEMDDQLDYLRERDRRVDDLWANYDSSDIQIGVDTPQGLLGNARRLEEVGQPTYTPQDPTTVANYAVPGA